jgi:cytochrome c-type biogenesis protein CcmH
MVEMARGGAAEARERGKLPPAAVAPGAAAAPAAAAEAKPAAAAAPGGEVTGTVRLSAALKALASPEDPLFVYARAAEGSRMPLAILRKQVKDLPLTFKLDDGMAMSPGATMSAAGRIVISARISKSGQAASQSGDLEGTSTPIAVGARDVVVEIGTKVP